MGSEHSSLDEDRGNGVETSADLRVQYTLPKGGANEVISIRDYDESCNKIIKQDLLQE